MYERNLVRFFYLEKGGKGVEGGEAVSTQVFLFSLGWHPTLS